MNLQILDFGQDWRWKKRYDAVRVLQCAGRNVIRFLLAIHIWNYKDGFVAVMVWSSSQKIWCNSIYAVHNLAVICASPNDLSRLSVTRFSVPVKIVPSFHSRLTIALVVSSFVHYHVVCRHHHLRACRSFIPSCVPPSVVFIPLCVRIVVPVDQIPFLNRSIQK